LAFGRIINVPVRGIGATSLRKIEDEAIRQNLSLLEFCQEFVENPEKYFLLKLSNKVRSSISEFVGLIQEAAARKETMASAIYQLILENSGYLDAMRASRDYESQARVENLEELASAIKQYESGVEAPSLAGFLETITLDSSSEHDENAASQGEVSLMTVHGAKGLEFFYVFVAGIEETLFPSFRSIEGGEFAIEEERRLFYVAMTRAMKKLYMTFAQGRLLFGQVKFNGPSRFLMEIPKDFYRWIRVKSESPAYQNNSDYDDMDQSRYSDDGPVIQRSKLTTTSLRPAGQYAKGIKVIHSLYGSGTVLDTEGQGAEEKVTIRFRDGARKKFLVKFAPLTLDESARS
jgi:DNA helicase-2/ATP-dependent DNA helicase PcrA